MKWNEIKITLSSVWVQKVSSAMGIPNKATSFFFSILLFLSFECFFLLWWKAADHHLYGLLLSNFFFFFFPFKHCDRPHVILRNVNKNCPQVVENFEHTCMFEWLCRKRNGTSKWIEKEDEKKVSLKQRKSIRRW